MKIQIGVIGPAKTELLPDRKIKILKIAEKIGEMLAEKNVAVITGGTDGIMEAVFKGVKKKNGITIGTPGRKRFGSNKYTDIEILTPMDIGNFLFTGISSCDSIIVIPGGAGTMSELCLAYRNKKPLIILKNINKDYDKLIGKYLDLKKLIRLFGADTPKEAVKLAIKLARGNRNE